MMKQEITKRLAGHYNVAIGLVASVISIFVVIGTNYTIGLLVLVFLVIALGVVHKHWGAKKGGQCALDDGIVFRHVKEDEVPELVEMDKIEYDLDDVIDEKTCIDYYRKNSEIYTGMYDNGKLIGYYAILPLKKDALKNLVTGRIRESDIKPSDILEKRWLNRSDTLWLFSMIVPSKYRKGGHGSLLISNAKEKMHEIKQANNNLKAIYATGATRHGQILLANHGFTQIQPPGERKDNHPLFKRDY